MEVLIGSKVLANSAEGAPWMLHRLRGVIYITWGVIDKVGFNQLFIPH